MNSNENLIIDHLIRWADQQTLVRAMLLTSSRAVPGAPVDIFSDYDVVLVLSDIHPFHADRGWLEAFGHVLVLYRDPVENDNGALKSGYVIQFEDGLKIDFSLWDIEILRRIIASPQPDPEFDAGYRILLDKDHLTEALPPPTYSAYIPKPPTETEYRERVEMFLLDATYVAKLLWRDDVMAAKFLLDNFMKHEHLLPVLEWHIELEHNWTVKPGLYGRRIKKWLRPDLWKDLESIYVGAGLEENWDALFKSIALMRKAANEVGERLGYTYPTEMERKTVVHLQKVKTAASHHQ